MRSHLFWVRVVIVLFSIAGFVTHPLIASAAVPCSEFRLFERPLPGSEPCIDDLVNSGTPLTSYIGTVVVFLTVFIVAIGLIVIVVGGYLYMTAGGSGDRVQLAKSLIAAAIIGIVLALTAYVLLNTISPQFSQPSEPRFR